MPAFESRKAARERVPILLFLYMYTSLSLTQNEIFSLKIIMCLRERQQSNVSRLSRKCRVDSRGSLKGRGTLACKSMT